MILTRGITPFRFSHIIFDIGMELSGATQQINVVENAKGRGGWSSYPSMPEFE